MSLKTYKPVLLSAASGIFSIIEFVELMLLISLFDFHTFFSTAANIIKLFRRIQSLCFQHPSFFGDVFAEYICCACHTTVWKVEKFSHLNEYNFVNMQDIFKIPFD